LRIRHYWISALLTGCALAFAGAAQPQKPPVFPNLIAYSLDKQKVTLPNGLEGKTDLLIISFAPEQQKDVASWLPAAQALQHASFDFHWYELPVTGKENFVFRWWETTSMRSDQTDPETWHWIVPLFIDREAFRHDLQIPNEKQVVVLLVDRQGNVLWRAAGSMTQDNRSSLMNAAGQH
jgi:ATP10 protein